MSDTSAMTAELAAKVEQTALSMALASWMRDANRYNQNVTASDVERAVYGCGLRLRRESERVGVPSEAQIEAAHAAAENAQKAFGEFVGRSQPHYGADEWWGYHDAVVGAIEHLRSVAAAFGVGGDTDGH